MSIKTAKTDYAIIPQITERWSPRAFADMPVEKEKILQLFEAARWAPSSINEQPWRFIISFKGEEGYKAMFEGFNEWNQKWAWTAPVIVTTCVKKTFTKNDSPNKHAWHDLGLAMGNLLAQATHLGLQVHQMAGINTGILYKNLHINPDEYEIVTMFTVGYQNFDRLSELDEQYHESEKAIRTRKGLDEILFQDKFGQDFDLK